MPSSLKVGKKGATYYISDKGKKVYADKLPDEKKEGVHPSLAKKVAGFKAKGQHTGESIEFDGGKHEIFVGGKGNHFYVNPKSGKKVILTKDKAKSLGLGGGKAKPKTVGKPKGATDEKLTEARQDYAKAYSHFKDVKDSPHATAKEKDLAKKKVISYTEKVSALENKAEAAPPSSSSAKEHPKAAGYKAKGLSTGQTNAEGHEIFKGKGGKHFTVSPKTGHKVFMTKDAAKAQGVSGGGKSKGKPGASMNKALSLHDKAKAEAASLAASAKTPAQKAKAAEAQAHADKIGSIIKEHEAAKQGKYDPAAFNNGEFQTIQFNKAAIVGHAKKEWAKLPASSQQAVKSYTGHTYKGINAQLRNGDSAAENAGFSAGNMKDKVKELDKAFTKVSTPENYRVYRGFSSNKAERVPIVGGQIHDKGYSSTSFSKDTARSFVGHKKHKMLVTVDVPKGSKAMYVDSTSQHKGEKELMVNRNSKFRITQVMEIGGVYHVKAYLEDQ